MSLIWKTPSKKFKNCKIMIGNLKFEKNLTRSDSAPFRHWSLTSCKRRLLRRRMLCFFYRRYNSAVGDSIWRRICKILRCKRLATKSAITDNDFRSPRVKLLFCSNEAEREEDPLAGGLNDLCSNADGGIWVRRVENGVEYNWDISRSMFSAGNITEKIRVANMNCSGNNNHCQLSHLSR